MTFRDSVWMLLREAPDFTPLDFSQHLTGTFTDDRNAIVGRWESRSDAGNRAHDFDLDYTTVAEREANPVPSGPCPSGSSLRVVLPIAAMWSASKAWRRPNV
jgi:hypothetical protein